MKGATIILLLTVELSSILSAQTILVKGNVSTPTEAAKNALITFTDADDTTKSYSTKTDSLGNYSIGLITDINDNTTLIPTEFELAQNYPNPFSSSTAITYKLNKQADVHVTIYDILGREVKTYSAQQQGTGIHGVTWDGENNFGMRISSGVYFYKVKTGNEMQIKKMILNRNTNITGQLQIQNYMLGKTNTGKDKITVTGGTYKVTVKSDTNTTPLIVIKEFPNQQIDYDTTLNYEVEKARVILYRSIDDVEEGDDSLTVINKLGVPNYISSADLDGYIFHYYDENIGRDLAITLYPTSAPKVIVIEADGIYSGKTKEGVDIGMYREEALKLIGMPIYTIPGPPSITDFYSDNSLKSSFVFTYDENEILIRIQMFP